MSPKGSSKRNIPCKTCGKKADFIKMYNDYFCPNCVRFANESLIKETKLPAIMKLNEYLGEFICNLKTKRQDLRFETLDLRPET